MRRRVKIELVIMMILRKEKKNMKDSEMINIFSFPFAFPSQARYNHIGQD